jgi:hemerythrin
MRKTSEVLWQDTQHQVLFALLDEIARDDSAPAVIDKLHFYAENHFALEESYMAQLDYPGRAEHLRAHDRFRAELDSMAQQPEAHDQASRQIISTFLTEWLKRHVFGIDKKLEAFLLEAGVH